MFLYYTVKMTVFYKKSLQAKDGVAMTMVTAAVVEAGANTYGTWIFPLYKG